EAQRWGGRASGDRTQRDWRPTTLQHRLTSPWSPAGRGRQAKLARSADASAVRSGRSAPPAKGMAVGSRQSSRIGLRPGQIVATQSISTSNGPCQADTQTKLRAGGSDGKNHPWSEFTVSKRAAAVPYTVHFMTFTIHEPA